MVNILGEKSVIKSGSFASGYIPFFYILVEDELAKSVIDCLCEEGDYFPKKYILSGAWSNQASCLYGFITYGLALTDIGMPQFGVVAIVDGDASPKEIHGRVSGFIKGDYKNKDQVKIIDIISNSIASFELEFKSCGISGLPEYNHKKWFEEITEEKIYRAHMEGGVHFLRDRREISAMLELVDFSKSVSDNHPLIKAKGGKTNYHGYYKIIEDDFRAGNSDHRMNDVVWYLLSCIKIYNAEKWNSYTSVVGEKIRNLYKSHRDRFLESGFEFRS